MPTETILLATLTDLVSLIVWRYSEKGTPKPKSIADSLIGATPKENPIRTFRSGADFDRALQRFIS